MGNKDITLIIGRGGNQKEKVTDSQVASLHCWISKEEEEYSVNPINILPTNINSQRIWNSTFVNGDDILTLGDELNDTVAGFWNKGVYDVSSISDWGVALSRFDRALDVETFRRVSLFGYNETIQTDPVIENSLKGCQAFYLIKEGKLRAAQSLIYDAGDALYKIQDGSEKLKNTYCATLILAAYLYKKGSLSDLQKLSKERADKMLKNGASVSKNTLKIMEEV